MAQPVNVLILGTGTVGASIGLALRRAGGEFQRVGYDPQPKTAEQAQHEGAVDRVVRNPAGAAREANLAILTLAGSQLLRAAEVLAGQLPPETVVFCTDRLQRTALEQLRAALGPAKPLLGTVPFLGPRRALAPGAEPEASAADYFDGGMLGIVAPPGTPEGVIEIGLDFAAILGATPFFLEPAELDSVTATSDELPTVLAAAMLESLAANPGWRDQRRLVGRPFARLADLLDGDPDEMAAEWIANRDTLAARLAAMADSLADLRRLLAEVDEPSLAAKLREATARYHEWRGVRAAAVPDHGIETSAPARIGLFDRLIGSPPARKRG